MKYWEQPHVAGHPLLIAVQDFHGVADFKKHEPASMSWSNTSLVEYLYGIRQTDKRTKDGGVEIVSEPIERFIWRGREMLSGFFTLPGADNISAVLANPGGTLPKFNRLGFLAGFGDRDIKMIQKVTAYQDSVIPQDYVRDVHSPDFSETWCEGVAVYHNSRAKNPLSRTTIPCAAHFRNHDGRILGQLPQFYPVGGITAIISADKDSGSR